MILSPSLRPADRAPPTLRRNSAPHPVQADPATHAPRIAVLDGVRGVAVLLVMAHHLFVIQPRSTLERALAEIVHQGTVGVDLFFVLSGFLITGILFDARLRPRYFRTFYARRTVRIFPLYYAVLIVFLIVLPRLAPNRFALPAEPQAYYWTYLANFPMGDLPKFNHVLHVSWSLCIEEQFYLVWPPVVLLLGRRALMTACGVMILASVGSRLGLSLPGGDNTLREYCWTFCRLDALAVGAWVALAARRPVESAGAAAPDNSLSSIGRLAVPALIVGSLSAAAIAALILYDHARPNSRFTGVPFYAAVALALGSFLVVCLTAPPAGRLARVVACAPLRTFGKYSYALYLFHLPIAHLLRDHVFKPAHFAALGGSPLPGQALFYLLATAVSLAAAFASWHLYEKHFLKLKRLFPTAH